jgi:NodT family efflux transporter outer membrane factor (OMF) lipoprotein
MSNKSYVAFICLPIILVMMCSCNSIDTQERSKLIPVPKYTNTVTSLGFKHDHNESLWPSNEWWRELKNEELNDLIMRALNDNQALSKAYHTLTEAEAMVQVAEARLVPSVGSALLMTQSRVPFRGTVASYNRTQANLYKTGIFVTPFIMNWEIDFWEKNRAAFEAAIGDVATQKAELEQARMLIVCGLVRAYIRGNLFSKQLQVAREITNERLKSKSVNQLRHETGIDTLDGAAVASANQNQAQRREIALEASVGLQRDLIARMIGEGPDSTLKLFDQMNYKPVNRLRIPKKLPLQLVAQRPDLAAALYRADVWAKKIHVAKTMFLPSVDISIAAGLEDVVTTTRDMNKLSAWLFNRQALGFVAIPGLRLPIFQGGRLAGNLDASRADYDQAVDAYNETLLQAVQQSADALVTMKRTDSEYAVQKDFVDANFQQLSLARIRIKEGLRDDREIIQERIDLLEARLNLLGLEADRLIAAVDLVQSFGGGFTYTKDMLVDISDPENDPITPAVETIRDITGG